MNLDNKTIYDITQDELDFLYAHVQKLKELLATKHNHIFMLSEEIKFLKKQLDAKSNTNKQRVP